jgi:hypothetical protein
MGQDGQYVDIPEGSHYYIYGNGETINGWSDAQFAALIGGVVDEIDWDGRIVASYIKQQFSDHFGGWNDQYRGGIAPPERGEIFCQCVDSRIDGLELTEELHTAVEEWVDAFDAYRECEYCGEAFRSAFYIEETTYLCDSDECEIEHTAETFGLTIDEAKTFEQSEEFDTFTDRWDWMKERADEFSGQ